MKSMLFAEFAMLTKLQPIFQSPFVLVGKIVGMLALSTLHLDHILSFS